MTQVKHTILLIMALMLASCSAQRTYFEELDQQAVSQWPIHPVSTFTADDVGIERMRKVAEDADLELYFNDKTTDVAVKTKSSGEVWYSNPPERFAGHNAEQISPQLELTSYVSGESLKVWNNFTDAVQYKQFEAEDIDNGIEVTYLFGKLSTPNLAPPALTEQRMQELSGMWGEDENRLISRLYSRMELANLKSEQQKNDLKAKFSLLADEQQVIYTRKARLTKLESDKLEAALQSAGYTAEDRDADIATVGYTEEESSKTHISLPVQYVLDHGAFVARVMMDEVMTTADVKLFDVSVLKYFGAAPAGAEGFALLPDGSGGMMQFDKLKSPLLPAYAERVYGKDFGVLDPVQEAGKHNVFIPVYGVSNGKAGFIGVVEEGDVYAEIRADAARQEGGYSYVYPAFRLLELQKGSIDEAPESEVNLYAPFAVRDTLSVRFLFLDQGKSGYADMANAYKTYLVQQGTLPAADNSHAAVPLVSNMIGAIDDIASIAGIPSEIIKPLTTFQQAKQHIEALIHETPHNELIVTYSAWRKGGAKHYIEQDADAEPKLGGSRGLQQLQKFAVDQQIRLFMDADFQYVYRDKFFDGFSSSSDAAKHISGELAYKPNYSIAHYNMTDRLSGYMLNPGKVAEVVESFIADAAKLHIDAIALTSMGTDLYSSFPSAGYVTRARAMEEIVKSAQQIRDAGITIASRGANQYILPYSDYVFGIPMQTNPHPLIDRSVPFLQIVLSGRVKYTTEPVNYEPDMEFITLKAIETGSALYFDSIAASNEATKETEYSYLYAVNFDHIVGEVLEANRQVTEALEPVYGLEIIDHRQIDPGVYITTYADGTSMIVNYNYEDRSTPYGLLEQRSYHVVSNGRG